MRELIVVRGETDGTGTTGTVSLSSDVFYSSVSVIRIPKGCKLKIWWRKVAGEGETLFTLQYAPDVTVATPSWTSIAVVKLASKGDIDIEHRRPIILRGLTGREGIQITWTQPTAAKAYIELCVEMDFGEQL